MKEMLNNPWFWGTVFFAGLSLMIYVINFIKSTARKIKRLAVSGIMMITGLYNTAGSIVNSFKEKPKNVKKIHRSAKHYEGSKNHDR